VTIWRCPSCVAELLVEPASLRCAGCGERYPVIAGVPDLRPPKRMQPSHLADRVRAEQLAAEVDDLSIEDLVARVFHRPDHWTAAMGAARVRRTLAQPQELRGDVRGWMADAVPAPGPFLDVGCGLGGLLSAAAIEGRQGIGIDQSLHLAIIAHRMIAAQGGTPVVAAGFGECIPLADGSVAGVTMQDVLEHVDSKDAVLREANRVLGPGGTLAIVVPNRFSVAAEPHVHLWGVGWLPRALQRPYVQWRRRIEYDHTVLPSTWELERLLRRNMPDLGWSLDPAPIPDEEVAHFSGRRAGLAHAYNRLLRNRVARQLQLRFGPSTRIIARRRT
jgi:SAM-dependent methyltransferase